MTQLDRKRVPTSAESMKTGTIVRTFVGAYREKVDADAETVFGLVVEGEDGGEWTVSIDRGEVTYRPGRPEGPAVIFKTDVQTLRRIYAGELNALTALGRAKMSDPAPMDIEFVGGLTPSGETLGEVASLAFHFFTPGSPEFVDFGEDQSRLLHGGNAVLLYYEPGLRTGWYQLKKGMVVNEDPEDQRNPFPSLFICTRGQGKARLDGDVFSLSEGRSVLVPAGMAHTFWNERETPFEFIIVMFGEGA